MIVIQLRRAGWEAAMVMVRDVILDIYVDSTYERTIPLGRRAGLMSEDLDEYSQSRCYVDLGNYSHQ